MMLANENTLLKAQIEDLERELVRYKTKKDSSNSSPPLPKIRTGPHVPAALGKRVVVKQEDNPGMMARL